MSKGKPYWKDDDEWGEHLFTPDYNPDFNAAMKDLVPYTERRWDRKMRAWWISHAWLDEVDALLRLHYEEFLKTRDF